MSTRDAPSPTPQNQAGLDRSGTGLAGAPNAAPPGDPDAPFPTTQRPADEEGPTQSDGSQRSPDAPEAPDTPHGASSTQPTGDD